jgi:hypothetical protein
MRTRAKKIGTIAHLAPGKPRAVDRGRTQFADPSQQETAYGDERRKKPLKQFKRIVPEKPGRAANRSVHSLIPIKDSLRIAMRLSMPL